MANVVKFVNCCTEQEIYFSGTLPYDEGTVLTYIGDTPYPGAGGVLNPGEDEFRPCYTVYFINEFEDYPSIEPIEFLFSPIVGGCEDDKCAPCAEPCYTVINCIDGTNLPVDFIEGTEINIGDVISISLPEESDVTLPANNCWTVRMCNLEILKTRDYVQITQDNIETLWVIYEQIFVENNLTQNDLIGNYFSLDLLFNIPGSPQGLFITGGVAPYVYFWEILNQSGTYSNVSIADSSVFPVELIQTGISTGDPFIRLKLTVTDSEGCKTELMFFTVATF
jgi:hypothetical protein